MTTSPLLDAYIEGYGGHMSGPNGAVSRVVIHATVSACMRGGARDNASYFQNPNSGGLAHVVVDPGETIGCCDEGIACWHAPPNYESIGVEMCDPQGDTNIQSNAGDPGRWQDADHQEMIARTARVVADICDRHGIPKVRIGANELLAGQRGICGHEDVSAAWHQTDHTDPDVAGPFPWDQFMNLVAGGGAPPTPTPAPLPPEVTYQLESSVNLTRTPFNVKLDGGGSGWIDPAIPFSNVVSVLMNGADPRNGGYIPVPTPSTNQDGANNTQIEIVNGPPNGTVGIWVWHLT